MSIPTQRAERVVTVERACQTFDNFMQLAFLLEDLLNRPVELVTPESISPYIRPYILKEVEGGRWPACETS